MAVIESAEARVRARWTDLATLGLLLSASGAILLLVAIAVFGLNPDERPFLLIVGGVAIVGTVLVRRFGAWGKVVGCVVALGLLMSLFWTAFGLSSFPSFFDFMPAVLVVPGAILALAACTSSIVAGRRGHRAAAAAGGERTAIRIAIALVVVLAVASGLLTLTGRSTVGASGFESTVVMKSFKFNGESYVLRPGTTVLVRNDDPFVHTFTVDALGINKRTNPGDRLLVRVPAHPGTFILYCTLHTSNPTNPKPDDMAAKVVIQ
jgi:plastocyanin